VAQPTIREALLELEFSGFVERVGPRKTRITSLTRQQIADAYVVRSRLEILAVELVVSRPDPDLTQCGELCREMLTQAHIGDCKAFSQADLDFHRALWQETKNSSLFDALERLVPKLFAFGVILHARSDTEKLIRGAGEHQKLIDLIDQQQREPALKLMEDMMREAAMDEFKYLND
jgi:DNA-binding GntR family transcriptional regulator